LKTEFKLDNKLLCESLQCWEGKDSSADSWSKEKA